MPDWPKLVCETYILKAISFKDVLSHNDMRV